jgi:hypothetical protein
MMRDMKDSERIRTAISKTLKPVPPVNTVPISMPLQQLNTCIVSKGYWESINVEESADGSSSAFAPPAFLKKAFEEFALKYQQFKRMRTVNFKATLGQVQLTLDFTNGSFKFRVTPFQAAIISLFNGAGVKTLSAEQIAKELDVTAEDVRRRGVAYWVCKGVLREQKMFR